MFRQTDSKTLYGSVQSLPLIVYEAGDVYAVISPQGAQLLEYRSKGRDFLWLSPKAVFETGKAIRGGVPICAPWFGVHPDPAKPKHGFVRNKIWDVIEHERNQIVFSFHHEADEIFEYSFTITCGMLFGDDLELTMNVVSQAEDVMPFSWAFHSYHPVSDLSSVRVQGLEGVMYLDATQGFEQFVQLDAVAFDGEIDRVYERVPDVQRIISNQIIEIKGENSPTAIVWNPGRSLAESLPDIREGYLNYICVERGAAFGDAWQVTPKGRKTARLVLSIFPA